MPSDMAKLANGPFPASRGSRGGVLSNRCFSPICDHKSRTTCIPGSDRSFALFETISLKSGVKIPANKQYLIPTQELVIFKSVFGNILKKCFIHLFTLLHLQHLQQTGFFFKSTKYFLRSMHDYTFLKSVITRDPYLLLLISYLLDLPEKVHIYSKLDLRENYNLIQMKEGNEYLTAFDTRYD